MYWVNGIIVQKAGSAPVNGDTVKTSAGAVFNIPFVKSNILKMQSSFCRQVELKLLLRPKDDTTIYDISLNEPVAIIMGSEDRG
jgi:23S rRNA (guanosine2251-2'-O)-methyltransferase